MTLSHGGSKKETMLEELIGLAILVILLIGAVAFVYHKISPILREIEARSAERQKLLQPRVVKGEGASSITHFTQAKVGNEFRKYAWAGLRIAKGLTSQLSAARARISLIQQGKLRKQIRFSIQQLCAIVVARLSSTGEYGYLTRDESWAVPATLFDKEGHVELAFRRELGRG